MSSESQTYHSIPVARIFRTWWPLAASWLLMGTELPALTAVIARLPEARINLAAYGGVIFPLALIIEAPIIMLLSASTALVKDMASYRRIYRFMMIAGAILTGLHILVAFTPLYDLLVVGVLGIPPEVVEPARQGLRWNVPWTWSIAYRRFNQGVLIRYGHSRAVGVGTVIRLTGTATVLALGYINGTISGVVVGAAAQAMGVLCEAIYAGIRVQPVLREQVRVQPPTETLTWKAFAAFYVPLVMTSILSLLWQPIGAAAISRMPNAVASLAVWSVLSGLSFMLRSSGYAYNEVVVTLMDEAGSFPSLRRFTIYLATAVTGLHLVIALTPLSGLWFARVSALPPDLVLLARTGFWLALPITTLSTFQSYFQGTLLAGRLTRAITGSMVIFMAMVILVLGLGIAYQQLTGLYVGFLAFSAATLAQVLWLSHRSRPVLQAARQRDVRPGYVRVYPATSDR